jgi:membrane-associated phospholipid phosphatase
VILLVRTVFWARLCGCRLAVLGLLASCCLNHARAQQEEPSADQQAASERSTSKLPDSSRSEASASPDAAAPSDETESNLARRFLNDQKQIWTSPTRLRLPDLDWLVPAAGFTTGLIVTDADYSRHISSTPKSISHYNTLSNAGVASLIGGAAGLWVLSFPKHSAHWRETGFLAGEAGLNSFVAMEALKYSLRRDRPLQGNGAGDFFQSGTSFPSEHSAAAWAVAGVIAHEYPGLFPKIASYGLASLVSFSRLKGRQHFPSDVFIGSIVGQLIAQDVYSRHHDPELGGSEWRSIGQFVRGDGNLSPRNQGSPYVPMDSWVYPIFDRLAALGLIDSAFLGMRPWTRNECARLAMEAVDRIDRSYDDSSGIPAMIESLEVEFARELESFDSGDNRHIGVESMYSRLQGISGTPLTDGYHFAETLTNDFGRPYGEGFNNVTGFSASATSGRLSVYIRAEYQHGAAAPQLSVAARDFIFSTDNIPSAPPAISPSDINRVRLLDAYGAITVQNWQFSFGKQTLWWGPSEGGPLMISDDASPIDMVRVSRVSPFKLPSIFGLFGPIRFELFFGQLAGHEFVFQQNTGIVGSFGRSLHRQPFIQGYKLGFKPTRNFEFGLSVTSVFAGGPTPLTGYSFAKSFSIGNGNGQPGSSSDPGDRRTGIDLTYRLPWMRDWLTFYTEALSEDEFSPIAYWDRSATYSGLFMPRMPKIPKLDLRVEGGYTDLPYNPYGPGIFYANSRYPNGFTNDGNLLGSWIGRQSQAWRAWGTYHLNAKDFVQAAYRHEKVSQKFMPGGATLNDFSVSGQHWLRSNVMLSGSLQYEKWNFPVLAPMKQSNVSTYLQFTYWPQAWK